MTVTKVNNKFCGIEFSIFGSIIGWVSFALTFYSIIFCLYFISYPHESPVRLPTVTFYASLAESIIQCAASILLIVGVIYKSHILLLPWLITTFFSFTVGTTVIFIVTFLQGRNISYFTGVTILIFMPLGYGVMITIWIGIISLFKLLKKPFPDGKSSTEECEIQGTEKKGDLGLSNLQTILYPQPPAYQIEEVCAPSLDNLPVDEDEHTV